MDEKIKSLIVNLRETAKKSKSGHLPLKERVLLLKAINDTGIIGKLYFECLKKVYPIWSKDFPNNPVMTAIIARAESFLYHQSGDRKQFETFYNDNTNYFESVTRDTGLAGMTALSLCAVLGYGTELEKEDYRGEDDDVFDWQDWTPDFYASMAYSGGSPFVGEGNVVRRKEFWDWYLDMVLELYKSPDNPQLLLPSLQIESEKLHKSIYRTQTYKTDAILNKLNEVINKTIDSYCRDYQYDWGEIHIEAYCMKAGLRVSSYFIQNGETHKIRGNVESFDLMNEIKYMMYAQNKYEGAWFASKIEINKDKTYLIEFNYDSMEELPNNWQQLERFVTEFEKFPRSKEFTPQWWQDILGKRAKYLKYTIGNG